MTNDRAAIAYQRELFGLFDEFFRTVTGTSAQTFATAETFGQVIRTRADELGHGFSLASRKFHDRVKAHYTSARSHFADPASFGGLKLVVGGGSRFYGTQFDAVRKVALYADTVLIPDPILPWLEEDRDEEKFARVELLRTMMWLLRLKPLVDADLPHPPVLVFPSFERSLDRDDKATQELEEDFVTRFFSTFCDRAFDSLGELNEYAITNEVEFLARVDRGQLFVPSGGESPSATAGGLEDHLSDLSESRTEAHIAQLRALPRGQLALVAVLERLIPQFHLLENAEELRAQPMLCFDSHWHYFAKVSEALGDQLISANALKPETAAAARGIVDDSHFWLGNVPVEALVELRRNGENEEFRRRIDSALTRLHDANLDNLDAVTAEITHELRTLIAQHQRDIAAIEDKYRSKHLTSAIGSWATVAGLLLPALGPFLGSPAAPLVLGGKYVYDKLSETGERKRAARSLMGVLASARKSAV